ncbi:hypothetical protein N0V92_011674 [Colletotrichum tropicale]|nr:hypothetical protein N0V92_011674 [Colletotrichum tropicale]
MVEERQLHGIAQAVTALPHSMSGVGSQPPSLCPGHAPAATSPAANKYSSTPAQCSPSASPVPSSSSPGSARSNSFQWIFYPDGHSVIRSEFGFPCTPYEYIDIGRQGFYSGPEPVKAITNDQMPKFRVRVNDTDPIFFYCGAPGSCYKEKMIGVINENSSQTLDKQLEAALPLTTQILPGEPFPTESDASRNDHHHLSGGAIAGIVIGCAAFLIFGGLLVYLCGRRGGLKRAYRQPPQSGQAGEVEASHPPVTEVNYSAQPKSPATQGWRNSHYSELSGTYRDQPTPIGGFPGASPPMSPQPHSMQAY